METYEFNFAFDLLWKQIGDLNKRIDAEKPWALAKTNPEQAKEVLASLVDELLTINERLAIFIPTTSRQIEDIFTDTNITPPSTPLFPTYRIGFKLRKFPIAAFAPLSLPPRLR